MKIAVVTGASSGLGLEYIRWIQQNFPQLQQIWVLARRTQRLQQLAERYPEGYIIPVTMDVTLNESYADFAVLLQQHSPEIELLINNAGCGSLGLFAQADYSSQLQMTDVNIRGLTALTSLCLKYMHAGAKIINVASISSFAPNARLSVYSATKAYVYSFSRSLSTSLKSPALTLPLFARGPWIPNFWMWRA